MTGTAHHARAVLLYLQHAGVLGVQAFRQRVDCDAEEHLTACPAQRLQAEVGNCLLLPGSWTEGFDALNSWLSTLPSLPWASARS